MALSLQPAINATGGATWIMCSNPIFLAGPAKHRAYFVHLTFVSYLIATRASSNSER